MSGGQLFSYYLYISDGTDQFNLTKDGFDQFPFLFRGQIKIANFFEQFQFPAGDAQSFFFIGQARFDHLLTHQLLLQRGHVHGTSCQLLLVTCFPSNLFNRMFNELQDFSDPQQVYVYRAGFYGR